MCQLGSLSQRSSEILCCRCASYAHPPLAARLLCNCNVGSCCPRGLLGLGRSLLHAVPGQHVTDQTARMRPHRAAGAAPLACAPPRLGDIPVASSMHATSIIIMLPSTGNPLL